MDCMIKESPIVVPTFIALLASSALISMFPAVVGTYINNFSATNVPSIFQGACFVICSAFASFMKSTLSGFANTRIARRLREDLYISFLRKDISFFDTNTSGRLASILASDVAVSSVVIDYLCQALRASISFVSGIFFSLKLAPIALIGHTMMPIALSFGLIFPLSRCVQKHTSLQMKRLAALVSHTEERISNIKTVKAFNAEKYEHGAFMLKIHDLFVSAITSTLYTASMNFIAVGAVGSLILLMVNTSATLVLDGTMKIGDVTSLLMYSALVGGSIQSFTSSVAGIQRCVGAAASVASYIDDNAILPINKVPTILKAPSIEFNNICFTYPSRPDLQILDDVSFLLPAGSKLLIFGESGCGKSSIIQLLLGFYKPNSGSISIDGRSLNDIDIEELRYMSGWVEQQGTLFNDSIRNNVLYGLENEMVDLSGPYKQSGLLEIVKSMPEGDQTNVGQLGKALSGGQRQRVSVARMFARNPKLVLLDEASSALDMESERQLNNALIKFLHDKTAIVVSHRTSLLPMADYIMVMTSGKISQFGTKDEVLKAPCQQLITMLSVE
ncbi:ABC transporter, ATP-binding domain containing protein [Babesia divergens]|uniref:ABC transporter, ATP-binding domain containing protein n=1 Tax=Babesia divergens TaxID=32595 RepID=A0AAD9GHQ7_BABDI|nr:ABC transporter, ATP-binding domain containing protein [Babesia divergens]